jgi:hypothetical protein
MPALVGTCWADGVWTADSWAANTWAAAADAPAAPTVTPRSGRYMHVRGTRRHRDWLTLLAFLLPFHL